MGETQTVQVGVCCLHVIVHGCYNTWYVIPMNTVLKKDSMLLGDLWIGIPGNLTHRW